MAKKKPTRVERGLIKGLKQARAYVKRKGSLIRTMAAKHELPTTLYACIGDSENENGESIDAAANPSTLYMDANTNWDGVVGVYKLVRVARLGITEIEVLAKDNGRSSV